MYILLEDNCYVHGEVHYYTESLTLAEKWKDGTTGRRIRYYVSAIEYEGES
jgi:predicted metal-dependent hydrolase